MTDDWAEVRSRQTKSVGNDVTASGWSKGVIHLEKVTSRQAVGATMAPSRKIDVTEDDESGGFGHL